MSALNTLVADAVEQDGLIGAQVAVLQSGKARTAAAGVCDIVDRRAVTDSTIFEIGSITKPLVAAALLLAQADGRVDLDAPVAALIPEWRKSDGAAVTGRQLLSHTSGLAGDFFPDTGSGDDCLAAYAALLAGQPLDLPSGTTVSYSNGGYVLAGRLLERALALPFDDALRELLTRAASHDVLTWNRLDGADDVAHGHEQKGDHVARVERRFPRAMTPTGGVMSSALSLARLVRALTIDSTTAPGVPAWLPEIARERLAPLPDRPASAIGWGWGVSSSHGELLLAHDGGTLGHSAYVRVLPDSDLVVALLVNRAGVGAAGTALINRVLQAVGHLQLEPPPPPDEVAHAITDPQAILGHYRRTGGNVDVRADETRIHCTIEVDEQLEAQRERLDGTLELQPSGLWNMTSARGTLPLLFLPRSSPAAACVLVSGRGHGRVASDGRGQL